jgi:hypothetical protein
MFGSFLPPFPRPLPYLPHPLSLPPYPLSIRQTILPLSLILLKREYKHRKDQGFLLVEIRIATFLYKIFWLHFLWFLFYNLFLIFMDVFSSLLTMWILNIIKLCLFDFQTAPLVSFHQGWLHLLIAKTVNLSPPNYVFWKGGLKIHLPARLSVVSLLVKQMVETHLSLGHWDRS